jgi:hypothetical protein
VLDAGSGVRRGAKLAGPGVRPDVQCGGAPRRSSLAAPQKTKASLKGSPKGGPVSSLLWKARTGLTKYDIAAFVILTLLLALVLVLLLR